jgi:hypothetical protein
MDSNSVAWNVAKHYGVEVAADMAVWTTLSLLGVTGSAMLRSVFGGFGKNMPKIETPEDWNKLVQGMVNGDVLPSTVMDTLPKQTQRSVRRLKQTLESSKLGPNDSLSAFLNGYTIDPIPGGYRVTRLSPIAPEVKGTFASESRAFQAIENANLTPGAKAQTAGLADNYTIQEVISLRSGEAISEVSMEGLARAFRPDASGQMSSKAVRTASQSILTQSNLDDIARSVDIQTVPMAKYYDAVASGNSTVRGSRILMPDTIRTPKQMSEFLEQYSGDLRKVAGKADLKIQGEAVESLAKNLDEGVRLSPGPGNVSYVDELARQAGKDFKVLGDAYVINGVKYASLDDAAMSLTSDAMNLADADTARKTFSRQFGIGISQTKDGKFIARISKVGKKGGGKRAGNIISEGATSQAVVEDLLKKGFVPRLDQTRAPQLIIDASGDLVHEGRIGKGMIRGPFEMINQYGKNYFSGRKPSEQILDMFQDTGREISIDTKAKSVFKVSAPDLGVLGEFSSYKEAKNFIKKKFDTFEELQELGLYKGVVDIRYSGGEILARNLDGQLSVHRNFDDLRQYISKAEAPAHWEKEISNLNQSVIDTALDHLHKLDPELAGQFANKYGTIKPTKFSDLMDSVDDSWRSWSESDRRLLEANNAWKKMKSAWYTRRLAIQELVTTQGRQWSSPTYNTVNRIAGTDNLDELKTVFEYTDKQLKNFRSFKANFNKLMRGLDDTGVSEKRRKDLLKFLETPESKWESMGGADLDASDLEYMRRWRSISDTAAPLLGVDSYTFLQNYLPRIRSALDSAAGQRAVVTTGSAKSLVKQLLGKRHLTNEVTSFVENLRSADLYKFVMDTDPSRLLQKYLDQGAKQITLGRVFNEVRGKIDEMVTKPGGDRARNLLQQYMWEVMGLYTEEGIKNMARSGAMVSDIFSKKIARVVESVDEATGEVTRSVQRDQKAAKDIIDTIQSLTVGVTMAYRPWPIIRNLQQIWTTLAPHYGNSAVLRAAEKLRDTKFAQERHAKLLAAGRLNDRIPIYGLEEPNTWWSQLFLGRGLGAYKNTDEYTRMIADVVVEDTFTPAVAKYQAGVTSKKQFLRQSGLSHLDSADQKIVLEKLDRSFEEALDYYGDTVTKETFFPYTKGANPNVMTSSVLGKLFGKFGHYPIYYATNLINGAARRGTPMDKLLFVSRVAFNTAALWFTFEKVWGVNADAFVPWKTAFFGGGPVFNLMVDVQRNLSGSPTAPSWNQIRRQAQGIFVPGTIQARGIARGLDDIEQGNFFDGWMQIMGMPDAPDNPTLF